MIEDAELYSTGEVNKQANGRQRSYSDDDELLPEKIVNLNAGKWYTEAPYADAVAVGGDPDNGMQDSPPPCCHLHAYSW
jgi:hypothetical protein